MAFSPASERPVTAAAVRFNPFRVLLAWGVAARAKRARRTALRALLDFDAARLDDLGIDRASVMEALDKPSLEARRLLHARRARSSQNWLGQ